MTITAFIPKLSAEQKFMISVLLVNVGNYLYNLILGRMLGPELFSDASLLITLLLIISFIAMTFQLTTTKFAVLFTTKVFKGFISLIYTHALGIGTLIGCLMMLFAKTLQQLFNTQSHVMFICFGIGIPLYFLMSVNRGILQGTKKYAALGTTYQTEMISRLLCTIGLIYILPFSPSISIAIGIVVSLLFGLLPFQTASFSFSNKPQLDKNQNKQVFNFFVLTAFYELTQIIINNSDIILVKHFFGALDAGLYASLALIGRVVYFITWMFVMLLFPKVVQKNKNGEATYSIFITYLGYIFGISVFITLSCYFLPETIIHLMFGDQYLSIATLLWKYAIGTSLFAISNTFAYYYLSLDNYTPILITGILGILQMVLIIYFHQSLEEVVIMQILTMSVLFIFQLLYFKSHQKKLKFS